MAVDLLLIQVAIVTLLVLAVALALPKVKQVFVESAQHSIERLEAEWKAQKLIYEADIKALRKQVDFLIKELSDARGEIEQLKKNSTYLTQIVTMPVKVLLICGDSDEFCNADRQALRRADVSFERLTNATQDRIREELRRKREDDRPWIMAHISSHAGDAGIRLADGLITPPAWWNEQLDGFVCVVLAACQTMTVADSIAGLVRYVVAIREDIGNIDASQFTFSFWRAVHKGASIPDAFDRAKRETPQVAEYVVLRTAQGD